MARNFYEEISSRNFYEKTASTKDSIKEALESFSTEEMEAIAEELNLFGEKTAAEVPTLESRVLTQVDKKDLEDKQDLASYFKAEGGTGKTEEAEATEEEAKEDAKTNNEKEEIVHPQAAESAGTAAGVNTVTSGNSSAGDDGGKVAPKEDAEQEKEEGAAHESSEAKEEEQKEETKEEGEEEKKEAMVLAAYDVAFEKLASAGYSLADYVYSKIENEKVALEVAENAEKLAYVTDQNPLKVADDIIETIFNIVNE